MDPISRVAQGLAIILYSARGVRVQARVGASPERVYK